MQPNTSDSTVRNRSRRLRAAVDRLESEAKRDADGASARATAEHGTASERRSDETGGVGTDQGTGSTTRTSGIDAVADRCAACGTTIGPREYRISRVVEQGPDASTLEAHYCSEACLTDDEGGRPEPGSSSRSESESKSTSSNGRSEPRDWSYCR